MDTLVPNYIFIFFFFFNDTATTEIYTLSLHDALPISNKRYHTWNYALRQQFGEKIFKVPIDGGFDWHFKNLFTKL